MISIKKYLYDLTIKQLQHLDDRIRLVVLHPGYVNRYSVLWNLLDEQTLYVRFEGAKLSGEDKQTQFEIALQNQFPSSKKTQFDTIILDEYDRSNPKRAEKFLPTLLRAYSNVRILLFTRHMIPGLLKNPQIRLQTKFIPEDASLMLQDYTHMNAERFTLEVRAFGEGLAILNGSPITNWDGILPRSLFFYMVDRGMVTRQEIFETFWPTLPATEATNIFHVTKRKITAALGVELTKYWSGFYRISSEFDIHYDVILFNELMQNSALAENTDEALGIVYRAISLYEGHFLNTLSIDWVIKRRNKLMDEYSDALGKVAELWQQAGNQQQSLSYFLRAYAYNRTREDIVARIIQLVETLELPYEHNTLNIKTK